MKKFLRFMFVVSVAPLYLLIDTPVTAYRWGWCVNSLKSAFLMNCRIIGKEFINIFKK